MEAINWEAVQAVSEALGLVVVVGSLKFVGLCEFQPKAITDSGASRSLIPGQAEHRFQRKPITIPAQADHFSVVAGIGFER